MTTLSYRFLVRGGTASALSTLNEIPKARELVLETDTGRMKRGDGVSHYNSLSYISPGKFDLTGIADGDVMVWNAAAGKFVAGTVSGGASDAADVAYDNATSGLAAVQVQAAIDELAAEVAAASSDGGILITGGSEDLNDALSTGFAVKGICAADYTITGWELWVSPLGSLQLDIKKSTFGTIPPTSSIVASAPPSVTAASTNSSTTLTGWTTTIARSDALSVSVTSNTGVKWFALLLKGTRT